MIRDFKRLGRGPFDVLVIGGGIYGAWTAYDAALSGLRVALVEQTDWAAATSSSSSKLIHGGLRYLEHFEFRLVRKTLDERRRLSQLAPGRVRPLRFVLPVYAGDRVGRLKLKLGLWLYDRLAGGNQPVPPHESLGARELLRRYGMLKADGLRGGFTYGDCGVDDARLTLEVVDGAIGAGAVAVNRARVDGLLRSGDRVDGAVVVDEEDGGRLEVRAAVTVHCAGPWIGSLTGCRLTKGVHLVLPPLPTPEAWLLASNDDRRIVFLIPWYGRTLLGTTDTDFDGDPATVRVEPEDVSYLLAVANRALRVPWSASDVIAGFAGLRTLPASPGAAPSSVSREWGLDEPLERLLVSVGGKYTSARADAATIVDRVAEQLRRPRGCSPTENRPFPWSPRADPADWERETRARGLALGLDDAALDLALERHGTRIERIFEHIRERPELAARIVPDLPFLQAELLHAATDEMARTLEDVLRRRVPLLLLSRLSAERLGEIAGLVGESLGWSAERRATEVASAAAEAYPAGYTERS